MMMRRMLILAFLAFCFCGDANALVVAPLNIQMPSAFGEIFSFDLTVASSSGLCQGFQATMGVQGPGTLSIDSSASTSVSGNSSYWIYGNSSGAEMVDNGNDTYSFGDSPNNAVAQSLAQGEILARYAFVFNGPIGWYTFTLDSDTKNSFSMNENFGTDALGWDKGNHQGTETSFDVYIVPEPASLLLLGLGGFLIRRK